MPKVHVCLSVDWEGEHMNNFHELKKLRDIVGDDIPMSHFICPAYYFRSIKDVTRKINTVIREKDDINLHIHCYKELVEAAGVKFRTLNNYYKPESNFLKQLRKKLGHFSGFIPQISGRGVPLTVYKPIEQEQIISFCRNKLRDEFPNHPICGFRAGGNIINDDTIEILQKLNFTIDSSATSPGIYSKGYSMNNQGNMLDDYGHNTGIFTNYIIDLWGGKPQGESFLKNSTYVNSFGNRYQHYTTQPFFMDQLMELPENCGMTDFVSPELTALPTLEKLVNCSKESCTRQYFHYGCHNEGDFYYKLQLLKFLEQAKKLSDSIEYTAISQCPKFFNHRKG